MRHKLYSFFVITSFFFAFFFPFFLNIFQSFFPSFILWSSLERGKLLATHGCSLLVSRFASFSGFPSSPLPNDDLKKNALLIVLHDGYQGSKQKKRQAKRASSWWAEGWLHRRAVSDLLVINKQSVSEQSASKQSATNDRANCLSAYKCTYIYQWE